MNTTNENSTANKITALLLAIYFMLLIWILLFKLGVHFAYMSGRRVNVIPFRELLQSKGKADVTETVLNVLIFIPLGIYAGMLWRWNAAKKMGFFFLVSLSFEALQFIFRIGAFDVTDIITNTFGGIIGLVIFFLLKTAFGNAATAQNFMNVVAVFVTVVVVVLLVMLKMRTLPIRYQ